MESLIVRLLFRKRLNLIKKKEENLDRLTSHVEDKIYSRWIHDVYFQVCYRLSKFMCDEKLSKDEKIKRLKAILIKDRELFKNVREHYAYCVLSCDSPKLIAPPPKSFYDYDRPQIVDGVKIYPYHGNFYQFRIMVVGLILSYVEMHGELPHCPPFSYRSFEAIRQRKS